MCVCVYVCVCVVCSNLAALGESHVMKNHDFSMPSIYTCKLREVSRGVSKNPLRKRFFWQGFLVVLRKLLSNFHRKFAFLEKPRFLLASVNGTKNKFV